MEGILSAEGLSPAQRSLRARARPKVLLATNYEEAMRMADSFRGNLLGLLTDQSFPRGGQMDREAGLELIRELRGRDSNLPVILQSSEPGASASDIPGLLVLSKGSKTLIRDLRRLLLDSFGFGPLRFRGPSGEEVSVVDNVDAMQMAVERIPASSLCDAVRNGSLQRWLRVHAELELADRIDDLGPPTDQAEAFQSALAPSLRTAAHSMRTTRDSAG
jgi:CheY-like chemotaxis protein